MVIRPVPGNGKDGGYTISGGIHVTKRELDVLALYAAGQTIEEVAKKLRVRPQTIKNHLFNIVKKLGASNRSHAVTIAARMGMIIFDRTKLFKVKRSEYLWCLHCERTYKYGEFREERVKPFVVDHVKYAPVYQMCPYEDCNGDVVLDAWEWDYVRESHPDYPEIPERGVRYPLY